MVFFTIPALIGVGSILLTASDISGDIRDNKKIELEQQKLQSAAALTSPATGNNLSKFAVPLVIAGVGFFVLWMSNRKKK